MAVPMLTGVDLNNQRALAMASPSTGTDGANKQYVDDNLAGLRWKQPVVAATTTNGTLASAYANGSTVDGISLVTGNRLLIKDQTAPAENGIYTVNASGAPTRATDADSTAELDAATVFVLGGTVNADHAFTQTATVTTIGTTGVVFVQFGGGSAYTASGTGITLTGTVFALQLDGSTLSQSGSGVRVGSGAAGAGIVEASGVLAVNPGTGLEVVSDAVRIAAQTGTGLTGGAGSAVAIDTSVVARKFSADIGDGSSTALTVTHNLGTKDVTVQVRRKSDDVMVYADVVATSTTVATITFASAPATNAYRATVIG